MSPHAGVHPAGPAFLLGQLHQHNLPLPQRPQQAGTACAEQSSWVQEPAASSNVQREEPEKSQAEKLRRNVLTLFFSEKVPGMPANRNLFFTFSFPRLATIRLLDFELSGMSSTGAPASISRRTREAR